MIRTATSARFALHRLDDQTWEIRDAGRPTFASRAVAHIAVSEEDQVEVIWAAPLPLPTTYATPDDALDSLESWSSARTGATKPIPIAHFPPPSQ